MNKNISITMPEVDVNGRTFEDRRRSARLSRDTRLRNEPDAFRRMGVIGAAVLRNKSKKERQSMFAKMVATRLKNNPDSYKEAGRKGALTKHRKYQ